MPGNVLFYGDNYEVMRRHLEADSVDLVYLDPPFNSGARYELLFGKHSTGATRPSVNAFDDTWVWDARAAESYSRILGGDAPPRVAETVRALHTILGETDVLAYVVMMAPRLVELRRVMKQTASIYLHCDPTSSHYLKVLMDSTFGGGNFRREIVWRSGWISGFKAKASNWARNHDVLLYYVKDRGARFTFNKDLAYKPHPPGYERRGGGGNSLGVAIDDVWDETALYSPWIKSFSKEKLGYRTQKPLALMERIIAVSSNPGDLVLDPFSGGGTTLAAAQKLGRRWIGIDSAYVSIELIRNRMCHSFGDSAQFELNGVPHDPESAAMLRKESPFEFARWAVSLVGGQPEDSGTANGGCTGRIHFLVDNDISVPNGTGSCLVHVQAAESEADPVSRLTSALDDKTAEMGLLITTRAPSPAMKKQVGNVNSDVVRVAGVAYPRIQVRSVGQLLKGDLPKLPIALNPYVDSEGNARNDGKYKSD